jgi:hypothetical protein
VGSIPITRSSFHLGNETIHIPKEPTHVGLTFAVQGVEFGSGTCPGAISLSNSPDFTVG